MITFKQEEWTQRLSAFEWMNNAFARPKWRGAPHRFALAALVAVAGCGGPSTQSDANARDGGADSGVQMADAGMDVQDAEAGVDPRTAYHGTFAVVDSPGTTPGVAVSTVYAARFERPVVNGDLFDGCTADTFGVCRVVRCQLGAVPRGLSMGNVRLEGEAGDFDLTMTNTTESGASYNHSSQQHLLPSADSVLRFVVSGADSFPAAVVPMRAPGAIVVASPALSHTPGSEMRFSAQQDFSVRWTGGRAGEIVAVRESRGATYLECTYPAEQGTGVIPSAALIRLGQGAPSTLHVMSVGVQIDTEQTIGTSRMLLRAARLAASGTNILFE